MAGVAVDTSVARISNNPSDRVRPPGPRLDPARALRAMLRDPLEFVGGMARTYGDVAYVRLGTEPFYLLSHPDHVRTVLVDRHRSFQKSRVLEQARRVLGDGLLTSEGGLHRRQRRMIQPAFHRDRLDSYAQVMLDEATRTSDGWSDGQEVDVRQQMSELTLRIVGRSLFGSTVGPSVAARVAAALDDALAMYPWLVLPFSQVLERLPTRGMRRFRDARATLDATVFELIRERRRAAGSEGDLLSLLLAARDDEGGSSRDDRMTDRQVRDEAMTLFLAGHETTANALTWACYLLSRHPAVATRLHDELDRAPGRWATGIDAATTLPITRAILSETLRLYPPSWGMGRRTIEDVEVGGYRIPARSSVMVSQWVIHHDPRWFPDPFRFDVDRWTSDRTTRPRHSYFPFGAGPRLCIGEDFAWAEGTIVLAALASRWAISPLPGQPIGLEPRITLRPKGAIRLRVHVRQGGAGGRRSERPS
jgi:cytochrome P450